MSVSKSEPYDPHMGGIPVAMPVTAEQAAANFAPPVMGVPVGGVPPPAYAVASAPMQDEAVPEGATRFPWNGPGQEYNSGILRAIATKSGAWENPFTMDHVNVRVSSMRDGYPEMIVDRGEPRYFCTEDCPGSWVEIDFGIRNQVRPSAYTMCSWEGASRNNSVLSWVFEATSAPTDDNWVVISEHAMDHTLCTQPRKPATWMVKCPEGQFYHRFRVRMTGPTLDGKHSLGVSCIELHGNILACSSTDRLLCF